MDRSGDTEKKILSAARKVFQKKGMYGARMQEIADVAEINKAMLHYYFRSKEQLFEAIFQQTMTEFFPVIFRVMNDSTTFTDKVRELVAHYIDEFGEKAYLPVFLINELHQDPERLTAMSGKVRELINSSFVEQFNAGVAEGRYNPLPPEHLIVNLISLVIFPILAQPILGAAFQMDEGSRRDFLEERKRIVPELFIRSITRNEP